MIKAFSNFTKNFLDRSNAASANEGLCGSLLHQRRDLTFPLLRGYICSNKILRVPGNGQQAKTIPIFSIQHRGYSNQQSELYVFLLSIITPLEKCS